MATYLLVGLDRFEVKYIRALREAGLAASVWLVQPADRVPPRGLHAVTEVVVTDVPSVIGMTDSRRSLHLMLITTGVLALLLGLLVALGAAPASAARATFTRTGTVFGGDPGLWTMKQEAISVPASPDSSTRGPASPYGSEIVVP